jgi:hypothetical protein
MPKSKDKKDKNPSKPRQPTEENSQRISSAAKASVARIRGSTSHDAKKKKKPHTPEFVDTDVDDSSEDEIPKKEAKKEKNMTKKEKSKTKKEKTKAKKGKKELLDEELSEGEVDIFPLSSKVLDIASKKEVPSAERVKWVECPLNDKLEYARNFTVNGKYILKLRRKDAYYHLLTTKNISGDEAPEDLTRKETRILKKIGLRPTTEAEDQNLSLDDSCDEEASDDADSDEESDDEDMHENKAEEKQLLRENPWMRPRCKGFTKQGRKCVKPVDKVDEYCTLHHTQASNRINKENVTWEIFPLANNLEYTYDICIRGRYPLKKRKEDLVVRLVTKEQLLRSDEWYTSTMTPQDKEEIFAMGYLPEDEYKPCLQQKQADDKSCILENERQENANTQDISRENPTEPYDDCTFLLSRIHRDDSIADNCVDEEQLDTYDSKYDEDYKLLLSDMNKDPSIADNCLDEQLDSYDSKYDEDYKFLLTGMHRDDSIAHNCSYEEQLDCYDSKYDDDCEFFLKMLRKHVTPQMDPTWRKHEVIVENLPVENSSLITPNLETNEDEQPLVKRKVTVETENEM